MSNFNRKSPKPSRRTSRKAAPGDDGGFKIKLRGKDNAPLSMSELRQGLYETARRLERYDGDYRARWVTIYMTVVDENGQEVRIDPKGEWTIYPYRSAADEHGA